jgi:hypothetical protein
MNGYHIPEMCVNCCTKKDVKNLINKIPDISVKGRSIEKTTYIEKSKHAISVKVCDSCIDIIIAYHDYFKKRSKIALRATFIFFVIGVVFAIEQAADLSVIFLILTLVSAGYANWVLGPITSTKDIPANPFMKIILDGSIIYHNQQYADIMKGMNPDRMISFSMDQKVEKILRKLSLH